MSRTGTTTNYAYDVDGIRVRSESDGVLTEYLVDANRPYAQVLKERNGGGTLVASYVYGDDLIRQSRSGASTYYHYDGQMSTRVLTDGSETVTDSYVFDAFGNLRNAIRSTENRHLYTGERYDPSAGFYYLRARYYDQSLGSFVSRDPFEGNIMEPLSLHPYIIRDGDPVNRVDPSGRFSIVSFTMATAVKSMLQSAHYVAITGFTAASFGRASTRRKSLGRSS